MKKFFCLLISTLVFFNMVIGQEATPEQLPEFTSLFIPTAGFTYSRFSPDNYMLQPSAGLQFMRKKNNLEVSGPELFALGANYSQAYFKEGLCGTDTDSLHSISLMGNLMAGKNTVMLSVSSEAELPFSSFKNITGLAMYTRQLFKNDSITFGLGGGIIVNDFGVKIGDVDIFVIPLPLIYFTYSLKTDFLQAGLNIISLPSIDFTFFPEALFRLKGSASISGINSVYDIMFNGCLACYPLKYTAAGDLLSISAGVKNTKNTFSMADSKRRGYQNYLAYGEINAGFLVVTGGWNFGGHEILDKDITDPCNGGFFASVTGMFAF